jgi:hypothetical protein
MVEGVEPVQALHQVLPRRLQLAAVGGEDAQTGQAIGEAAGQLQLLTDGQTLPERPRRDLPLPLAAGHIRPVGKKLGENRAGAHPSRDAESLLLKLSRPPEAPLLQGDPRDDHEPARTCRRGSDGPEQRQPLFGARQVASAPAHRRPRLRSPRGTLRRDSAALPHAEDRLLKPLSRRVVIALLIQEPAEGREIDRLLLGLSGQAGDRLLSITRGGRVVALHVRRAGKRVQHAAGPQVVVHLPPDRQRLLQQRRGASMVSLLGEVEEGQLVQVPRHTGPIAVAAP